MLPEKTASDEAVLEILRPLKMLHWLKPYLTKEKSGILDVQIVHVTNAYCKPCEEGMEEKAALERIGQEYGRLWDALPGPGTDSFRRAVFERCRVIKKSGRARRRLRSGSAATDRGRSAECSSARTDRAHISAHEAQTMDTEDPKGGPCHAENAQKAIFCQ